MRCKQHQRLAQCGDASDVFLARRLDQIQFGGTKMKQPLSNHQHPSAERRVHLMGREGEIVDPARFHLDLAMGDQLCCIHQQACSIAMHDATDLRQIVADAEDIRSAADGHQFDALAVRAAPCWLYARKSESSSFKFTKPSASTPNRMSETAAQRAPRQFVRVVFEDRIHHDRLDVPARIHGADSRPPD